MTNLLQLGTDPMNADQLKQSLTADAIAQDDDAFVFATQKMRGLLAGKLNQLLGGKTQRYLFVRWLFDLKTGSTNELSAGQVRALLDWLDLGKDYEPSDSAKQEAIRGLIAAEKESGQRELLLKADMGYG